MSLSDTRYILPDGLMDNMYSIYSPAIVDGILHSFSVRRKTTLRINSIKGNEGEVIEEFKQNKMKYSICNFYNKGLIIKNYNEYKISKLNCYERGEIYLQSLSSMIPPIFMELKENLNILDMCAAPGSKTSQIAAEINNKGNLLANEKNAVRGERLKYNLQKLGITCSKVRIGDARDLDKEYENKFERILVDAPCSGEGIINIYKASSYKKWNSANVYKNSKLQKQLLESAYKLLIKGGILVYSTCTISAEENEEVVDYFLKSHSDIKVIDINLNLSNCSQGIIEYKGKSFSKTLKKAVRIIPNSEMEGFFICKLKKV